MKKRVELLAPAGNYQALVGAFNAGADAVYLGGDKFGARAYAANFSKEELCRALRYAHIIGRKIYLTVNTLIKEKEFVQIYDYISPFYEAGLDGIIIQDLGVWQYIRETFPGLPLHASTQMTITGEMGARLLKENGAARIVPARELSLEEIKKIKKTTGLEIECFIHGAMCYCYSGQCLFSSMLGGRSGNRGRCAQPCRLPYRIAQKGQEPVTKAVYPLSLKDMCTIELLPELLEAGIDSFKIEGRMKKPAYAAGVTAIYRKYIDAYYQYGKRPYHVKNEDLDRLKKLYIRSDIQTGYYKRANGKEMITYTETGYIGADETLCQEISEKYLREEKRYPVAIKGVFQTGEVSILQIEGKGVSISAYGGIVERALKKPLEKEAVLKHLRKAGNTFLQIDSEDIVLDNDAFISVGQINDLRRHAMELFENELIRRHNLTVKRHAKMQDTLQNEEFTSVLASDRTQTHILIQSDAQLQAVCQYTFDRLYLDSDYYMSNFDQIGRHLGKRSEIAVYLALPYVVREKDTCYFHKLLSMLDGPVKIKGFLIRNLESLFWTDSLPDTYDLVSDAGMYCYNNRALAFLHRYCTECYLPYELNEKECRQIIDENRRHREAGHIKKKGTGVSMIVYGTIPMMVSANCIKKTAALCPAGTEGQFIYLQDRYQEVFPVLCNCQHCYNVIYNSVPYSLHQKKKEVEKLGLYAKRLDFVGETGEQTADVLAYYFGEGGIFPFSDYTAGHFKRGVE